MDTVMTDDLVGRHRAALIEAGREAGAFLADDVSDDFLLYVPGEVKGRIAKLTARIEALEAENRKLREAIKPFADCADQLDGSEWTPRAPDGEWARFRLLTDDYRAARAALTPEPPHAD